MPKVKVPRKSTTVDMTAMTDVSFLLLTFFMLATKFKPDEPVVVDTPSSTSEIQLPESGVIVLTIDKNGRVFFTVDGQHTRAKVLERMGEKYNIKFTPEEIAEFSNQSAFGIPIGQMKEYLTMKAEEKSGANFPGVPMDSTNNQLADWIWQTRLANNDVRVAIKGDRDADMPTVKRVMAILQEKNVNRFNFITSLESGE